MTGLEDVFGESFAEQFEEERARRINSQNFVDDQTKAGIAYKIAEENEMDPTEPMFQFTDDNGVTHDVLLMSVPDPEGEPVWTYLNELQSGAVSLPLDYMGEWMSVLFNDSDMIKDFSQGDEVIVIGNLDQWTPDGSDEPEDQVSPARGTIAIEEVPKWAKKYEQGEMDRINDKPEETTDNEGTDDTDDGSSGDNPFGGGSSDTSSGSVFGTDDDEEEEDDEIGVDVDKDALHDTIDQLIERKEEVKELEKGDDSLNDVSLFYLDKHHDVEQYDKSELEDIVSDVNEMVVDYLEELRAEEEEEDDDDGFGFDEDSIFS